MFGEFNEYYYYEPIKTKSSFNGNYIKYESRGNKDKNLSLKEYLDIFKPYLRDMINDHKAQFGEWKIQLSVSIKFISSKDSNETRIMHTWSDNIEIMIGIETDYIIDELFKSLLQEYQESSEKSQKGGEFVYDSVDLLYYHLHKISLKTGKSNIDSPEWLKNKKTTINPKNKDNKCFKYAITIALNHERFKNDPQIISKIEPFMSQYKWKNIDFPATSKDWKKFEQDNHNILTIIIRQS